MVPNPANPQEDILEPLSKMTEGDKKKYIADVKRLMYGSDISDNVRHSRLMDEFDNSNQHKVSQLLATRMEKICYHEKSAKNHDLLAPIAHSNASSSHPHAHSSYSPQSYYVTHPSSVVDYDKDYQEMEVMKEIKLFSVYPELILLHTKQMCSAIIATRKAIMLVIVRNQKFVMLSISKKMLLAIKDEVGSHLSNEENDFVLDDAYGEESLDELTASIMLMAQLQLVNGTTDTVII
nr:hypothetical protein [Tanacetum cinerariifolium]